MVINDYFDHVYCINLDSRADKWGECIKIFEKHGLVVERFSAIDGKKLAKSLRGVISPGEAGCSHSHLAIYHDMIARGFCNALILEDDVDFIPDLSETFDKALPVIPEWDLLYLGGTHMVKPVKINEYFGKISKTFSTSHYALTNEVAARLIDTVGKCQKQVDVVISDKQPDLKSYVFMPSIAWQRPTISDIHGIYVDYTPFMKPKK